MAIYLDPKMKQAQSQTRPRATSYIAQAAYSSTLWNRRRVDAAGELPGALVHHPVAWTLLITTPLALIWFLIALPFRLIFLAIAFLGRVAGVTVGFSFMVVGVALGAGPLFFIGIPLFLVGLFVMLRSLE